MPSITPLLCAGLRCLRPSSPGGLRVSWPVPGGVLPGSSG